MEGNCSINQGRSSTVEQKTCCCGCVVHPVHLWGLISRWLLSIPLNIYSWLGNRNHIMFCNSSAVSPK